MKKKCSAVVIISSAILIVIGCAEPKKSPFSGRLIWVRGVSTERSFWRAPGVDCFRPVNGNDIIIDTTLVSKNLDVQLEQFAYNHNKKLSKYSLRGCEG